MNQQAYRELISGQNTGLVAAFLRLSLRGASWFYLIVTALRNFLYSQGWLKIHRVNAVVISIGNITAGGTGKTPLVIWLCKSLQQKGFRCAVLTRGYKTHTKKRATSDEQRATRTDEPAILAKSCPEAKVIVNPDRVAGAAEAINKFGAQVLIMDDGFQHRRLNRDLDIVTIDAMQPFGYGKILPAGLLREPVAGLKRADAVVITRCDQISESQLSRIEKKLQAIGPNITIASSMHTAVCAKSIDNREVSLEQLKDKKVFAFCGIGNPDAFMNTIKGLGTTLVGSKIYNDHHHYTDDCLADIYKQAVYRGADLILTTQKDWTKVTTLPSVKKDIPFAYLAIELNFLAGEDRLRGLIEDALAGKIPQK
ncbi:MAG: tetraacyldisaccharide 4'-kinase [Planctomycetota bacterium]